MEMFAVSPSLLLLLWDSLPSSMDDLVSCEEELSAIEVIATIVCFCSNLLYMTTEATSSVPSPVTPMKMVETPCLQPSLFSSACLTTSSSFLFPLF